MKRWQLIILLFTSQWCGLTFAQTSESTEPELAGYYIEIIVFQQPDTRGLTAELWPSQPPYPTLAHAIELGHYNEQGIIENYQILPPSALQLAEEIAALERNKSPILLHQAWYQETIDQAKQTKPIHISSQPALFDNSAVDNPAAIAPFERWRINGTISISQLNYFTLDTDLMLNLPITELKPRQLARELAPGRNIMNFQMQQTRRLRTDELYYLDHPLFGLLIKITDAENYPIYPVIADSTEVIINNFYDENTEQA